MANNPSSKADSGKSSSQSSSIFSLQSFKYIFMIIFLNGVAIGIAFLFGQLTYSILDTNASNAGHIYGIITSSIVFFMFIKYFRNKKDVSYLRSFLILYFIVYFSLVCLILLFLYDNPSYFFSTLGNAFILFSLFILMIFIFNPEILGISDFKSLFSQGRQARVILVYLIIILMQISGYAMLNYAINWYSGGTAFQIPFDYSLFDFFYLSVITFVTIGYGEIHPLSNAAKFSTITQAIASHIISILFLAILFVYISSYIGSKSSDTKSD